MIMRKYLFTLFLLLFLLSATSCGKELTAGDSLESKAVVASQKQGLPDWLLLSYRSKSLSDEQLGFILIESEQIKDEQESKALEEGENQGDETGTGNDSNLSTSSSVSDPGSSSSASSANTNSAASDDESWDRIVTDDKGSGTFQHKIKINQD